MGKLSMEKASFSEKEADTFSTISAPPPYSDIEFSTKYIVKYKDWRARHGEILDASTSAPIYTTEHRYRKPTFALNTPTGEAVATACSSKWTMRFDMSIPSTSQNFELTPRHKMGCSVSFPSPAFSGQTLTWTHRSSWSGKIEYVLLDANALPIARFTGKGSTWKCMSSGSFGEFEFVEGRVEAEAQRVEVLSTGLCLAYKVAMNQSTAAAGSAGASSAGVAAAVS